MAPVGMFGALSWFSSPEVGIISLVAFLVLSITLLALCAKCHRGSRGYDVSGATHTDGAVANGNSGTKTGGSNIPEPETSVYSTWRNHKDMPPSTLDRATTTN